jgi:two-component system sensor histidine kinase YesM
MSNPFKKYRIDYLFFGSFAILIVAVLGCTVWTSYALSSKELAETTSINQQKLLDQLNQEIAARLVTIEQISLSTSRDNTLVGFLAGHGEEDEFTRLQNFKDVQQSLANLTYSIPLIQGIDLYMKRPFVGDPQSYIQFRDLSEAPSQIWYEAMKLSDSAWTQTHVIHAFRGDVKVISFVRSIEYNNRHLGYLVIHAKAETLENMLAGSSGEANRMMLGADGKPMLAIGRVPSDEQWAAWSAKLGDGSGVLRVGRESGGSGSLLVYSRSDNSDWTMVEITPWKQITAGSLRLAQFVGLIGVGAILLALLLTLWLSRQLSKPIKRLVREMNRYSVGSPVELPDDYRNEFGYLFSGYRKQMERIDELYRSLERRHEQQRRAEIEALQANINPHFLYNTLDQLNWMAIAAEQPEMSRILELMGRMFRISLSNGESFITVAEEIEHIGCYLEIQQLRRGDGLTFEVDAPEDVLRLYMPKMILQPFVENAVIHGLHMRDRGNVSIRIRREETRLRIVVEDDGAGLRAGLDLERKRKTGGYGVRNVKERIKAYFGELYGVALSNRPEGGARAEIVLPVLLERPGFSAERGEFG